MSAMSAAMAITTMPIGFASERDVQPPCAAVHKTVAARANPIATVTAFVATDTASNDNPNAVTTPSSSFVAVLFRHV